MLSEASAQGQEIICGVSPCAFSPTQVHIAENQGGEVMDDGCPPGQGRELAVDPLLSISTFLACSKAKKNAAEGTGARSR